VDFSPLDGIVDHQRAIRTWRDPGVYAMALASFAADHSRDADELERLLLTSPDNWEQARAVAHTLKGVAGNLCVTMVANLVVKIDFDLKSKNWKAAVSELGQLRGRLAEATNAIGRIVTCDDDATTMAKAFDLKVAVALLGDLSCALEKRNPYAAEPILAGLAEYLSQTDLMAIQQRVDAFDFKGARISAGALAETLGLKGD
jgi:HPt (histidine-containing phosphotransfer) domain-containing protein